MITLISIKMGDSIVEYPWNLHLINNMEDNVFPTWKVFNFYDFLIFFVARNVHNTNKSIGF